MAMPEHAAQCTFIGTATALLRVGGFTLLTDPNFLHRGQRAYLGYGLWSKRRSEPALAVDELPPLDAVVLSHLHGDHFDRVARRGLDRSVPILSTPQAARRLRRTFTGAEGLTTWSTLTWRRGQQELHVTAVPARHGPRGVHRLFPPTMGSVVDLVQTGRRRLRIYLTGDTLPYPGLEEIAERFPDIDAMLIHLGGTRLAGVLLTMDGRQGAYVTELIRARLTLPVHYDDYGVFTSSLPAFTNAAAARGLTAGLQPWARGETVQVAYRDDDA